MENLIADDRGRPLDALPTTGKGKQPLHDITDKPKRNYEHHPSRNRFFCDGRLLMGGERIPVAAIICTILVWSITGIWAGMTALWWSRNVSAAVAAIGAYLCLIAISNMYVSAMQDPGILPRMLDPCPPNEDGLPIPRIVSVRSQSVRVRYCQKCEIYRPPRATHCSICDNCVDGCDHHCAFYNNCIGRRNYLPFLVSLISMNFALVLMIITAALHPVILARREQLAFRLAVNRSAGNVVVLALAILVIWWTMVVMICHVRLVLSNVSATEHSRNSALSITAPNPFSHGTWWGNLLNVFCHPQGFSWLNTRGVVVEDHRILPNVDARSSTPEMPRSSYPSPPSSAESVYGTPQLHQIGVHHPRAIMLIERDYHGGELAQFSTAYYWQIEGRITETQFRETINEMNKILISTHALRYAVLENALAIITLQFSGGCASGATVNDGAEDAQVPEPVETVESTEALGTAGSESILLPREWEWEYNIEKEKIDKTTQKLEQGAAAGSTPTLISAAGGIFSCLEVPQLQQPSHIARIRSTKYNPLQREMEFVKALAVLGQVFPITNGTFGGVSGQDSVWRAIFSLMDHSLGLAFFMGLCNMVFEPSPRWRAHNWDFLHTRIGEPVSSIEISYRHEWLALASQQRRSAEVHEVQQSAVPAATEQAAAGPSRILVNEQPTKFTPNLSMFIIPYLLIREPTSTLVVRTTRKSLRQTTACSVGRFAICIATLILLLVVRVTILLCYTPKGIQIMLLVCNEVGRAVMIVMQESSILTYSCAFKSVSTWASPYSFGPEWTIAEQEEFHKEVVQSVGAAFHARAVFWLIDRWWRWMGKNSARWQKTFGLTMCSKFNSPSDEAFQREELTTLRLRVKEPMGHSSEWLEKYVVDFEVPKVLVAGTQSRLRAKFSGRVAASPLLLVAFCGFIGTAGFLGEGGPRKPAIICFIIMQMVAWLFLYMDVPNQSINCMFHEVDNSLEA